MRKVFLLIGIIFLIISCEKNYLIPAKEIPGWLKKSITENEDAIKSDPKSMQNYGAWIRYEFRELYYYEYDNPLSSFYPNVYSEKGNPVNHGDLPLNEYLSQRCCVVYIWKAPGHP